MSASVSGAAAPDSTDPDWRGTIDTVETIRNAGGPALDESMIVASEIDIHGQKRARGHARRAVDPALRLGHPLEDERGVAERRQGVDPNRDGDGRGQA